MCYFYKRPKSLNKLYFKIVLRSYPVLHSPAVKTARIGPELIASLLYTLLKVKGDCSHMSEWGAKPLSGACSEPPKAPSIMPPIGWAPLTRSGWCWSLGAEGS